MTVYLIQCQVTGNVKIGYTSREPKLRFNDLIAGSPTPLELLKVFDNLTLEHEKELHRIYRQYRIKNEWFTSEVLQTIDETVKTLFPLIKEEKNMSSMENMILTVEAFEKAYILSFGYQKINSYIDRLWQQEALRHGMSLNEYFKHYLDENSHVVLKAAYMVENYQTSQDLDDLIYYTYMMIKLLENPREPYYLSLLKNPQHPFILSWERRKEYCKNLAHYCELALDVFKRELELKNKGTLENFYRWKAYMIRRGISPSQVQEFYQSLGF